MIAMLDNGIEIQESDLIKMFTDDLETCTVDNLSSQSIDTEFFSLSVQS